MRDQLWCVGELARRALITSTDVPETQRIRHLLLRGQTAEDAIEYGMDGAQQLFFEFR